LIRNRKIFCRWKRGGSLAARHSLFRSARDYDARWCDNAKKLIDQDPTDAELRSDGAWLDIKRLATVEVTSEDPNYPIESVFTERDGRGWRAAEQGHQVIRLIFDEPQKLQRVCLRFSEMEIERTQEFTLRWSGEGGLPLKELVRQQWNFSPRSSTSEVENYRVNLDGVLVIELAIKPEISHSTAVATLASWRMA
jgi:hypothetical protein